MKSNTVIYQIDAFTNEAFKGNPAGVMILENSILEERMQNIAAEMNLSETAFVTINDNIFNIRYFTPTSEIPLCGHATLASAHIIYELGMKKENETINFKAKGGSLQIFKETDGIKMIFPKYTLTQINIPKNFKSIIGFSPVETYACDNNWIIALANEETDILNVNPDFSKMNSNGLGHLMITSTTNRENIDFVVRCFAPIAGIDEDPVTGSAQCGLVPFWNLKTKKTEFNVLQISKRTGLLKVKLADNNIEIKGDAITIFKADLKI